MHNNDNTSLRAGVPSWTARWADYFELTKPRVTTLVLVTMVFGFYLGSSGRLEGVLLLHAMLGTALVAAGTSTLNQYLERDIDARMLRTRHRPLPAARLQPRQALLFGVVISLYGIGHLAVFVNFLTSFLAALTLVSYCFVYTPLKQRHPISTIVGAVPGALPPLGGWTAVRGELSLEGWVLFAILFLWQLPHFLAIAWLYRDDYARGGFPMLPVIDPEGHRVGRQIVSNCLVLLPVSLLPTLVGMAGVTYFFGALVLSLAFIACGAGVVVYRSNLSARRLMRASLVYLPALLALMALDKTAF